MLIGKRLKPVTADAEVEVKKASIKDSFRVLPGIINKAVPTAINTIKPITNCRATGTGVYAVVEASRKRIMRCRQVQPRIFVLGMVKTRVYSFQVAEFRQAALFANEYQDIIGKTGYSGQG